MVRLCRFLGGLGVLILALLLLPSSTAMAQPSNLPINHIIVIYQENRSFDNLFGKFPGANGLEQPGAQVPQVDKHGVVYQTLPQPYNAPDEQPGPAGPDQRFPTDLPH